MNHIKIMKMTAVSCRNEKKMDAALYFALLIVFAIMTASAAAGGASHPTHYPKGNFHQDSTRIGAISLRRGSWVAPLSGVGSEGAVVLVHQKTACTIIVHEQANSAVKQAARFLSEDIKKISGVAAVITDDPRDGSHDAAGTAGYAGATIHLVTLGLDKIPENIDTKMLQGAWEAYKIVTTIKDVWLIGSNPRGTAFAAYELSERLGVDPLYLWTGYQPVHHNPLMLKKTDYYQAPPVFKYRGFFHDDEDILPRPYDDQDQPYRFGDVPLDWYKRFFETALRLKMNMVAPYTRVRRRYEVQQCASDWGLFYTSHHYDILLSNPFGIERFHLAEKRGVSTDWDWFGHPRDMLNYWKAGVEENKDLSIIWPIGLRGTDDHAYRFPAGTSGEKQAAVFGQVLDSQVHMVLKLIPAAKKPVFAFTLYTEMLEKYEHNRKSFHVPGSAIIVWPDDNDGVMRNLPTDKGIWQHGVYYHLAYFGGSKTKQNVHTVSPERMAGQFENIITAGATRYLLVNVSELRAFVMGARMISEICWQGRGLLRNSENGTARESDNDSIRGGRNLIRWWSAQYFGLVPQQMLEAFYSGYFRMLYSPAISCYGADMAQQVLEKLYRRYNGLKYAANLTDSIRLLFQRDSAYAALFSKVKTIKGYMNASERQFFFENAELPLLMDYRQTEAACILYRALTTGEQETSLAMLKTAQGPLEKLELELLSAERPPFENWYQSTWIRSAGSRYNLHRSFNELRTLLSSGGKKNPIPIVLPLGHRIPEHRLWSDFLDRMDSLKRLDQQQHTNMPT